MSDRPKCTPPLPPPSTPPPPPSSPPPPEQEPPGDPELLRHAFLWRFSDPEDRAAVERLCYMLWLHLNEAGEMGPTGRDESPTIEELTACAFDLMACATDLERISRDPEFAELDACERRLCQEAKRWAREVAAIVEHMCIRLDRPIPSGGPPASDPNGNSHGCSG